ncbi:putative hemolysin [Gilliamella apicola]|nr:putative hemolysin [Gilliamella apicola]
MSAMGSDTRQGIDMAVSLINGLISGDMTGAAAGALAPKIATIIKQQTEGNTVANTVSHAILGAVVAELQGNSALVGGLGAAASERGAEVIAGILYPDKDIKDLSQEERQQISALSQLATGLAIAAMGGDIQDINTGVAAGKNAVENNGLSWADGGFGGDFIGLSPETGANYEGILHASAAGYLTPEEASQIIDDMNSGKFMYDPLREDLMRLPEDIAILVTPYGDYIAFRDADSWGDYAIASAGVLPFAKYIKVAGKVIKVETKTAQALVKEAEVAYKAGNVAEGNRLMNQAASQSKQIETTVVKNSAAGKGISNISTLNPSEIRFSQNTVSYNKVERGTDMKYTYDDLVTSMKTNGWKGEPVNVIKMPDGKYTSMDNTRIAAAREAGIDIKANIRNFDDKLSPSEVNRFSDPKKGFIPTTWGEAITGRINKQSGGFSKNNPYGSSTPPRISGKPKD